MKEETNIFANPEAFHAHLDKINKVEEPQATKEEIKDEPVPAENTDLPAKEEESAVEETTPEKSDESILSETTEPVKETKYIPRSRLNQELEKKKALESDLLKERENNIRLQTQLEIFQQLQQSSKPKAPEVQLPSLDKIDALDKESHQAYVNAINKATEVANQAAQKTQEIQYAYIANAQKQAFEKENPDYMQAVEHLKQAGSYRASLRTSNPDQINALVMNELNSVGLDAINSGKNAAEVIYNLAKAYGYKTNKGEEMAESKPTERGANIDAITRNMKKTSSIQGIGNNLGLGSTNKVVDINSALRDPKNSKSGIDPEKFRKMLGKAS